MATVQQVTTGIQATQAIGDSILQTLEDVDPAVELPASAADTILDLTAQLVTAALTAYSTASGTPIDAATIAALAPNPTPLSAPTA